MYTLEPVRASERAYRTLRQEIIEGQLPPGSILGEVEQSARLGLSRTPLREAIGRLVSEGLAAPSSGRGTVVTEVSLDEADDLFDLRTVLEVLAARRAAVHADPEVFAQLAARFESAVEPLRRGEDPESYYRLTTELDAAVDAACANAYLAQHLRSLRVHLARLRRFSRNDPARLAASATEHASIARALADRNPELAAATTTLHLHHALAHLQSHQPTGTQTHQTHETHQSRQTGPAEPAGSATDHPTSTLERTP
ncbi:GntR family transcriptional regulator [Citricoccus zhacaiensis]|uniref:GntR family transcriptional regulator n=1 Tax=Citricoccus zhacaiensis TaxID=489142 RepID=A0ABQ2M5A5_9MICC|nr:GntR family transcriptional regulator [Citricoccus zhacaiensis]